MAERGIIFTGSNVRAITTGTKVQTRRVIRFPIWAAGCFDDPLKIEVETDDHGRDPEVICNDTGCLAALPLPFAVGDRLWVREAFCPKSNDDGTRAPQTPEGCYYRADGVHVILNDGNGFATVNANGSERSPWRSPIHMPRWASRLTLAVTDVRVERLQNISEADAIAEGVGPLCQPDPARPELVWVGTPMVCKAPTLAYRDVWNSIHGKDAWEENPWVAAITFEVQP